MCDSFPVSYTLKCTVHTLLTMVGVTVVAAADVFPSSFGKMEGSDGT